MHASQISVIIPTLNEEQLLPETVSTLLQHCEEKQQLELIVIDGGSEDRTISGINNPEVGDIPIKIEVDKELRGRKDRALARGLSIASGEIVLFLDADTLLPPAFDRLIRDTLKGQVVGGAFNLETSSSSYLCKAGAFLNKLRYRLDGLYYGDQAFFALTASIKQSGGFPDAPLMEISYLCKQLRATGTLQLIDEPVRTSCRRFEENGMFRVFLFDVRAWIKFLLEKDLSAMATRY